MLGDPNCCERCLPWHTCLPACWLAGIRLNAGFCTKLPRAIWKQLLLRQWLDITPAMTLQASQLGQSSELWHSRQQPNHRSFSHHVVAGGLHQVER